MGWQRGRQRMGFGGLKRDAMTVPWWIAIPSLTIAFHAALTAEPSLDAVAGFLCLAIPLCAVFALVALEQLWNRRVDLRHGATPGGFCFLLLLCVLAGAVARTADEDRRLDVLLTALHGYESTNGHPAPAVKALVPQYLDALPQPTPLYRVVDGHWQLAIEAYLFDNPGMPWYRTYDSVTREWTTGCLDWREWRTSDDP